MEIHKNLRIIKHLINKKQGGAKNTGVKSARGKYIAFVDQDDYIESNILLKTISLMENSGLDMLAFKFKQQYQNGVFIENGITDTFISNVQSGVEFIEKYFNASYSLALWAYFYRRDFWIENNFAFAENVLWEDADIIAQCLYYSKKIQFIPESIYFWCFNNISISRTISGQKLADRVKQGNRKLIFSKKIFYENHFFSTVMHNDGIWNATVIKKIIYLPKSQRTIFYSLLNNNEYDEIKSLVNSKLMRMLYENTICVRIVLWILYPFLKFAKYIRFKFFGI
jgi:glycosyltransferase involved in cell wall biosynthesis